MYPYLNLFNLSISSYHLLILISIFVFILTLKFLIIKFKVKVDDFYYFISLIFILGLIGSKVFYVFEDISNNFSYEKFLNFKKGFVLYGGVFFVFIGSFIYCKSYNINFLSIFDLISICLSISMFFGKIACLLAGCCYGIPTKVNNIGIVFKNSSSAAFPKNEPLFPTQIFDGLFGLFLFCFLFWFKSKISKRNGFTFVLFFLIYSVYRFFSEFYRADESRGFIFNSIISLSQFYSILVFLFFLIFGLIFINKTRKIN